MVRRALDLSKRRNAVMLDGNVYVDARESRDRTAAKKRAANGDPNAQKKSRSTPTMPAVRTGTNNRRSSPPSSMTPRTPDGRNATRRPNRTTGIGGVALERSMKKLDDAMHLLKENAEPLLRLRQYEPASYRRNDEKNVRPAFVMDYDRRARRYTLATLNDAGNPVTVRRVYQNRVAPWEARNWRNDLPIKNRYRKPHVYFDDPVERERKLAVVEAHDPRTRTFTLRLMDGSMYFDERTKRYTSVLNGIPDAFVSSLSGIPKTRENSRAPRGTRLQTFGNRLRDLRTR